MKDALVRFIEKIDFPVGCWNWEGAINSRGYGSLSIDGEFEQAHRASYRLFVGAIPSGMCVLHACDNPKCVNPRHLFLGTNQDNVNDKIAKGRLRVALGERQWKAKLTEENVLEIRERTKIGEKASYLAKVFGVHHSTINAIVAGVTWKHVPLIERPRRLE